MSAIKPCWRCKKWWCRIGKWSQHFLFPVLYIPSTLNLSSLSVSSEAWLKSITTERTSINQSINQSMDFHATKSDNTINQSINQWTSMQWTQIGQSINGFLCIKINISDPFFNASVGLKSLLSAGNIWASSWSRIRESPLPGLPAWRNLWLPWKHKGKNTTCTFYLFVLSVICLGVEI